MKIKFFVLAALCFVALAGARPMLRGFPIGTVVGADLDTGAVSVDLGSKDWVMKGLKFSVVDKDGQEVAEITSGEVYSSMFWSDRLGPAEVRQIVPRMQVRWVFTPEISALIQVRKQGTASAYKEFLRLYPKSQFMPEVVRGLPDAVLKELNPDFYEAKKTGSKEALSAVIAKYPGSCFAEASKSEIKDIESYEAQAAKDNAERAKRAAEEEAEEQKREALEEKMRDKMR
ncbi:MAG: hypothetical protein ABSG42_05130, partial [Nitrospirota bacterium]